MPRHKNTCNCHNCDETREYKNLLEQAREILDILRGESVDFDIIRIKNVYNVLRCEVKLYNGRWEARTDENIQALLDICNILKYDPVRRNALLRQVEILEEEQDRDV